MEIPELPQHPNFMEQNGEKYFKINDVWMKMSDLVDDERLFAVALAVRYFNNLTVRENEQDFRWKRIRDWESWLDFPYGKMETPPIPNNHPLFMMIRDEPCYKYDQWHYENIRFLDPVNMEAAVAIARCYWLDQAELNNDEETARKNAELWKKWFKDRQNMKK